MAGDARRLEGAALAAALRDSRSTTLARTMDVAAWPVPRGPGANPVAWELGHLAWFAEFWILRGPHRVDADGLVFAARPARIAGPDAIFDSSRLA
ncbi:MAG: DinB family protein, partial [Caldimonas sp.]